MLFQAHPPGHPTAAAHDAVVVARDIGEAMIDDAVLYKAALGVVAALAARRISREIHQSLSRARRRRKDPRRCHSRTHSPFWTSHSSNAAPKA